MRYVEWYEHYGTDVAVFEEMKGKHKDYCLCYKCEKFNMDSRKNCELANQNFENCQKNNMVLVVWECPEFETKMENLRNEYGLGCA